MESYEVVIIGAGPGGLASAKKLAQSGKKVLLLEKNNIIGPKVCAGGISPEVLKHLNLPDNLIDFKFKEATLHTPRQKSVVAADDYFVNTIDRKNLGQWQMEELKKTGAVVRTNAKVTKIGANHVIVNDSEKIEFEYLIGADGSSSTVRRHLKLKIKGQIAAIQYIVPGDKYKKFEIFFNKDLFGMGYAWIFPHKGYASIGCGCEPRFFPANKLMEGFKKWISSNNIDITDGKYEAFPINYDYRGYKFDNIFLIGDAAGLASCLTGGGIYYAIISGEEVAKEIIDRSYVSLPMKEIEKKKKKQKQIFNFLHSSGFLLGIKMDLVIFILKSRRLNFFLKYLT